MTALLPFEPCSSIWISGQTGSGKTRWVYKFLKHLKDMYTRDPPSQVLYCYGIYQPLFDEMEKTIPQFTCQRGLPSNDQLEDFEKDRRHRLIIIDDLMHEVVRNQDMELLFTQECHHRESCSSTPILGLNEDGTVTSGNIEKAIQAVKSAEDIRLTVDGNFFVALDNTEHDLSETMVRVIAIWHINQQPVKNDGIEIMKFQDNSYWAFSIYSTNADRFNSYWNIGDHVSRGASYDKVSTVWFSDCCWKQMYKHYRTGTKISGSLVALLNAVKSGSRLKILHESVSLEADEIQIRKGTICASFLNSLSKSGITYTRNNLQWVWRIACTTGNVNTLIYEVGSNQLVNSSTEAKTLVWFVDDRQWDHVLSTTETGSISTGSKSSLQGAVRNGAQVRYRLRLDKIEPGFSLIHQADNLKLVNVEVSAMHVRSISLDLDGQTEVKFKTEPFWCFTMATTSGRVEISRWAVGIHSKKGHTIRQVAVEWFINA